jgi:hypothetical protein
MRTDIKKLPEEIQKYGFDFHWDNKKVWSISVPVEEIDIDELLWSLDKPFWTNIRKCDLCPMQVVENLDSYPLHKERILNADTSHPIDIMQNQLGKWLFLDGVHRFVRLLIEGNTKIKVRKFSRDMIPLIEYNESPK